MTHDWAPVVSRIGTHADLRLMKDGTWRCYGSVPAIPTPATVDGLMLAHCVAWLDERGVDIRRFYNAFLIAVASADEAVVLITANCEASYPTRIAATIAAVLAAAGEGEG